MLEGIRVLDLSRVIAGPYCAMLLGDLGADVVKLERPGRGDDLRALRGDGVMSAVFAAVNRNKRGIAVELGHPEGAKLAFELARRADVVIENFLPGGADRLGLGYAAVRAANPGVVYLSVTGFGQTGPYARRPGYNSIAQAMSGLMAVTGMPGHPPTKVGGSVADLAAAYVAFGAVNAALVHRVRTGEGQHLDVNLLASTLGLLPDPVAHYLATGVRPGREGNRNPNLTPAEAYRTADGYLTVVLMNPDQWERFCRVLGDDVLRDEARFATNEARLANREELRTRVETALATAPTADWVARFEAAAIAAGPIYEFDEVFADPQVRHLGLVTEVAQPGYGPVRMLDAPFRASAMPALARRPAPRPGEHTAEVLAELGLTRADIDRLAEAGTVMLGGSG
ncbi:MAG TPA: CoA transferase [Methylomirabilota bacterium]|jgi:crotonobetainyl-CoA:carnitine CoA-transferase CaiB-like acyl-CoA transferase|nr:CoA transferase [Methylomirabilota bacterium]